jgi:cytochrome c553
MSPPIVPASRCAIRTQRRSPTRRKRSFHLVEIGDPDRNIPPCGACHRRDVGGPIDAPVLSEQRQEYLTSQLKMFASGQRRNDVYGRMRAIAAKLTDAESNGLAAYYRAGFR